MRPTIPKELKRVNYLITVDPKTRDYLQKHKRPAGRVIEDLLAKDGKVKK